MRGRANTNGGMRRTELWEAIQQVQAAQLDADDALHAELISHLGKERYEAWARAHLSSLHEWRTAGRQLLSELVLSEVQKEQQPHA